MYGKINEIKSYCNSKQKLFTHKTHIYIEIKGIFR